MANNKTKQTKDLLLHLLQENAVMPLEAVYVKCDCDYDALAGALSSLIEKEEIAIGRLKTKSGWLIGHNGSNTPAGGTTWHTGRGQMRHTLPRVLKELKKYTPARETQAASGPAQNQIDAVNAILADGQPRSRFEIIAATGNENLSPQVWQRFARLPDGRYTLPDSSGAREFFFEYVREKPRRLSNLLRLFQKHKSIRAMITDGDSQGRLIRLPRAMITTTDSPAGQTELERRRQLQLCQETLEAQPLPFFTTKDLYARGINPQVFQGIADQYAITVKFAAQEYLCLRREFPGEVITGQLREITGHHFTPPAHAYPPVFLKAISMGEKEAMNFLGIGEEILDHLIKARHIECFTLDGKNRIWRHAVQQLKAEQTLLREITREYEKLTIPQAAVLLGITTGQCRRLISEGKLGTNLHYGQSPENSCLFKRKELEEIQKRLPEILAGWPAMKKTGPDSLRQTGRKRFPTKKKTLRRKELKPLHASPRLQLDEFQIKAIEAFRAGHSVLVSAPTGNGKTLVAEILARDLMAAGRSLVYTSPLKALSNQKYRDFMETFGADAVGLVTGDISINADAPLLIMTTEIFRNWCLGEPEKLTNTFYVVFDEIHYLDDSERGTTWEESILFAPRHIKLLGLSATVPNIREIADWIGSVRGEAVTIIEEKTRFVPLEICWVTPNGQIVGENKARQEVADLSEYNKALRNRRKWAEE